jgi:hypothetical protein
LKDALSAKSEPTEEASVKYLLLINKNEAKWNALSDEGRREMLARYQAYGKKMADAGILSSGAVLQPTRTATTVRVREGKRVVSDGPFAETAEQIAGLAIIEVADLDEALTWAAGHPDAEWASVEIRPVMPWKGGH